jgi:secretion/DNA translocation related TadE-like protein
VIAAAMVAVLLCVTGAGAYLGSVVVARHRAQAAADLAALAGAARLPSGSGAACTQATAVAHGMHVDSVECRVDGLDVVVTVRVAVAFAGAAQAAARAGPADRAGSSERAKAERGHPVAYDHRFPQCFVHVPTAHLLNWP